MDWAERYMILKYIFTITFNMTLNSLDIELFFIFASETKYSYIWTNQKNNKMLLQH